MGWRAISQASGRVVETSVTAPTPIKVYMTAWKVSEILKCDAWAR